MKPFTHPAVWLTCLALLGAGTIKHYRSYHCSPNSFDLIPACLYQSK